MTKSWEPKPHEIDSLCNVYIDESSQTKFQYLVLGALHIPYTHQAIFDQEIGAARIGTKINLYEPDGTYRVMKWQKVSEYSLDAYKNTVKTAFDFRRKHIKTLQKDAGVECLVVDLPKRPLLETGGGDRDMGYEKELYLLVTVSVARRFHDKLFHIYPDRRETKQELKERRAIFNAGIKAYGDFREYPVRRLRFGDPETSLGLQVVDIFIGALAYRLNGHYDAPNANAAKKELCDYIWATCKLPTHLESTPYRPKLFMSWMHRPKREGGLRRRPHNYDPDRQ